MMARGKVFQSLIVLGKPVTQLVLSSVSRRQDKVILGDTVL